MISKQFLCLLYICLLFSCKESIVTIDIDEVHFPDAVFREAIYSYLGKKEGDTLNLKTLQKVEELDLSTLGITSIKGIEYFTNLKTLDCGENLLTEVDVSRNAALGKLELCWNMLTHLDVSGNPKMRSTGGQKLTKAAPISPGLYVLTCALAMQPAGHYAPIRASTSCFSPTIQRKSPSSKGMVTLGIWRAPSFFSTPTTRQR